MGLFTRTKAQKQTKDSLRREDAVFEFSRRLVAAAGIAEIGQALLRIVDDVLGIDRGLLLAVDEIEQRRAWGVAALGSSDKDIASISIDLDAEMSAVTRVIRDRVSHRVLDASAESLHDKQVARALGDSASGVLYVPLYTSSGVLGVLIVSSDKGARVFRSEEVDVVQKLANDAAVAIERAQFAQQLREVGERELIVASVARAVRESLDPNEVLRIAAQELADQLVADQVEVAMRQSEGLDAKKAVWSNNSISVEAFNEEELAASALLAIDQEQAVIASTQLSLPLKHRNVVNGVLTVEREADKFDATEVRLIELIAVEIAAAIEHVRLYEGSKRHLDEQLVLAKAAQSLTADLRFDRVIEHMVSEVVKLLRTESASFYTYNRELNTLTLSAAVGENESSAVGERIDMKGLAGRVIQSGVSQLTNSYQDLLSPGTNPVFVEVKRAIAVPVRWQGDLRGVIAVTDRDERGKYTERDQSLLEAFADLASLALHNADAYSNHSRQARIQAGFYRISQILSASLSRQATLASLAQAATEVLDGDWGVVIGGGEGAEDVHIEGNWLTPTNIIEKLCLAEIYKDSAPALATLLKRSVTSREIASDERFSKTWRELMADNGVSSQLAIPVHMHGEYSATVLVCFRREVRFTDEELVVANNLATAATAALERADLFENEQKARSLSEVLAGVSALIAETLKAQTVLERIVDQAAILLEVDACSLAVSDKETSDLHVHSSAGHDSDLVSALLSSPIGGLVEEVARSQESISVTELASEGAAQSNAGESYESFLGVPLRHPRGHLIGVLSVYSRRAHKWSKAEISALESFASSAAIAVRNSQLYDDIQRERERLQTMLESIGEGILSIDTVGRVQIWNRAASELTGIPHDKAKGRPWRDVLGLSLDTEIKEGQSVIEAYPNGAPMFLSVTSAPVRRNDGAYDGWVYAFRDVSTTYTLDRLKSDFVSTVSYVLRTPLTSIYGFATTLLRKDIQFSDDDKQVFLQYIATESERLTSIVDDLLQVSAIDAGAVEIQLSNVNVDLALREALNKVREKGIRCQITVHELGQALCVKADMHKLETVLMNIIVTAASFTPENSGVRIEAFNHDGQIQINVHDGGSGLSLAEQQHLFTKFYISPNTTENSGSGLGLYISKGLVDAMGGRLWVSSQVGEGSTFTVELPLSVGERNGV